MPQSWNLRPNRLPSIHGRDTGMEYQGCNGGDQSTEGRGGDHPTNGASEDRWTDGLDGIEFSLDDFDFSFP